MLFTACAQVNTPSQLDVFNNVATPAMDLEAACYPIEMQCDGCEYSEEMSEYYGQEVWMCA